MSITLDQAKVGMTDKVNQQVVDMFRRSSMLLDKLTFDNAISPGTGGSTLAYGYVQLKTPSTAAVRTINSEYTAGEAIREEKTTKAIITGGSFEIDRVIQDTSGAINEIAFQTEQKVKATANEFSNLVVNGSKAETETDTTFVPKTFDGLRKLLAGTQNEMTSTVDISTSALTDTNGQAFLDELDEMISTVDGTPSMLLMNKKMLSKVRSVARRAGYYERTKDDFGRVVETYNGIPMVDAGQYYDGENTVDIVKDIPATSSLEGTSQIYAVVLGLDGLFGISPTGSGVVKSYMPDLTAPGAVKKGEVELVAGIALRNTLKAAVLKGIKTSPHS